MVGKVVRCALAVLVGACVGTELFAYLARLAPQCGPALYRAGLLAIYGPWMLGVWAWQWGWIVPRAFVLPALAGLVVALLLLVKTWPKVEPPQAQAHWATTQELRKAECLSDTGIVLGKVR